MRYRAAGEEDFKDPGVRHSCHTGNGSASNLRRGSQKGEYGGKGTCQGERGS